MEIKLPFGRDKNNRIVHITEVERGKKCNCVCPDCGSPLIASKGNKNQHHFKHSVVNECKGESAVHLAAKQILLEKKQITLSRYVVKVSKRDSREKEHTEQKTVVEDGTVIHFDSVQEEIELPGMKADILAKKNNKPLIIEIFYCHKVDDEKRVKIAKSNISAIEINLSKMTTKNLKDWETFWSYINNPQRVQWLHNAKACDHYPALHELLEKKILEQEKYKKEDTEKQEQAKQELERNLEISKTSQSQQYSEFNNQPLLLNRRTQRRGAPIDKVLWSNRKLSKFKTNTFVATGNRKSRL